MKEPIRASGSPWYQNSWPWFLVILLGVSVLASLGTVVIAYRHGDVDVRNLDPAKSGGAIGATPATPDRNGLTDSPIQERGN